MLILQIRGPVDIMVSPTGKTDLGDAERLVRFKRARRVDEQQK